MAGNFFDNATSFEAFDAPLNGPQSFLGQGTFGSSGVSSYDGSGYNSNLFSLGAVPSLSADLSNLVSSGGSSATTSGVAPTSGASSGTPNNPLQLTVGPSPLPQSAGGTIADYFIRAVIIVLGFIFVAVGLTRFRSN